MNEGILEVSNLKEGDPVGIAWLHDACGCLRILSDRLGDAVRSTA